MGKSCDFTTNEASTKAWFRTNKIIDSKLNIIEGKLSAFRAQNTILSKDAFDKYSSKGIKPTDRMFLEEDGGRKAVPNIDMFRRIDAAQGKFYPENMQYQGANFAEVNASLKTTPTDDFMNDLDQLELTTEVIKYLYAESGSRSKIQDYAFILRDLVANLKSQGFTTNEILEDIKCL
jgi:hypothetical protein